MHSFIVTLILVAVKCTEKCSMQLQQEALSARYTALVALLLLLVIAQCDCIYNMRSSCHTVSRNFIRSALTLVLLSTA
jgi:hypothetical protein